VRDLCVRVTATIQEELFHVVRDHHPKITPKYTVECSPEKSEIRECACRMLNAGGSGPVVVAGKEREADVSFALSFARLGRAALEHFCRLDTPHLLDMSWALGYALDPDAMMEYAVEEGLCPEHNTGIDPRTGTIAGNHHLLGAAIIDFARKTGFPAHIESCIVDEETAPVFVIWQMTPRSVGDFKLTPTKLRSRESILKLAELVGLDEFPRWYVVEGEDADLWVEKPPGLTDEQLLRVVDKHMCASPDTLHFARAAVKLNDPISDGRYKHLPSPFRTFNVERLVRSG
jgi:hypothetical protein